MHVSTQNLLCLTQNLLRMKWSRALCDYWEELLAALATQRASRPARVCVVRRSQCLHRASRKLLMQAWQTWAYNPLTGPACVGMLKRIVSRERRD